ncbi:MAG: PPC domain-containing protein [Myxococcales bacterium]|nr:PPC domain-containing protein [Myxococcales bacterium]MCB9669203.1 PPC domain-containing protein [Alphaproteobacteria bacterium]
MLRLLLCVPLVVLGCRRVEEPPPGSETDTDTDTDTATPDVDSDADADADADADSDADTDTDDCLDDDDEPVLDPDTNPTEGPEDALQLSSADDRRLTLASPVDYWRFAMTENNTVTVTVTFPQDDGNIDVEILGPDRTTVVATGTSTDSPEVVTFTADVTGAHYLKVIAVPAGCRAYGFTVSYQ